MELSVLLQVVVLLLLGGCDGSDAERSIALDEGVFLPRLDVSELTPEPEAEERQFDLGVPRSALKLSGWGHRRRGWQPIGEQASLLLRRRAAELDELYLDIRRPDRGTAPIDVSLELAINGETVSVLVLEGGQRELRVPIPRQLLAEVNRVDLRFQPPVAEGVAAGEPVVVIRRIGLLRAGDAIPEPRRAADRRAVDGAERLLIAEAGTYVVPLQVPAATAGLEFEVRSELPEVAPLAFSAVDLEGGRHQLEAVIGAGESVWKAGRISLEGLGARQIFLVVEAEPRPGGRIEIRGMRLSPSRPETAVAARGDRRGQSVERPDILLVILDAARADRFANPAYPRPTSPRIDALAEESIVFGSAFSECSNTSCSIPNLVVGLPFLAGPPRELRLGDRAVTLAERLSAAGYRTVGLSANPYNSESWGAHQGFDEFTEMWEEVDDAYDPVPLSEMAVETIASQPKNRPLYLQLHYLPPHLPYEPTPEFDLFTDPEYRGPIEPETATRPYNSGQMTLTPEDLAQLVGLYDGVARRVDAAVGTVLDALRDAGRWPRSVVLVTADHGEGFMEHGRLGHQSTIYDEMIRVPFVLRLPGGGGQRVDSERLVVLTDVVPTLLGLAGIEPPAELPGADLLAPAEPIAERVIFTRTGSSTFPWLSARTSRWKLILETRYDHPQLYDLEADPAESVNLALNRPLLYAGLGLLVRDHLRRNGRIDLAGESATSTEVEREKLRALGYLD